MQEWLLVLAVPAVGGLVWLVRTLVTLQNEVRRLSDAEEELRPRTHAALNNCIALWGHLDMPAKDFDHGGRGGKS